MSDTLRLRRGTYDLRRPVTRPGSDAVMGYTTVTVTPADVVPAADVPAEDRRLFQPADLVGSKAKAAAPDAGEAAGKKKS